MGRLSLSGSGLILAGGLRGGAACVAREACSINASEFVGIDVWIR